VALDLEQLRCRSFTYLIHVPWFILYVFYFTPYFAYLFYPVDLFYSEFYFYSVELFYSVFYSVDFFYSVFYFYSVDLFYSVFHNNKVGLYTVQNAFIFSGKHTQ